MKALLRFAICKLQLSLRRLTRQQQMGCLAISWSPKWAACPCNPSTRIAVPGKGAEKPSPVQQSKAIRTRVSADTSAGFEQCDSQIERQYNVAPFGGVRARGIRRLPTHAPSSRLPPAGSREAPPGLSRPWWALSWARPVDPSTCVLAQEGPGTQTGKRCVGAASADLAAAFRSRGLAPTQAL